MSGNIHSSEDTLGAAVGTPPPMQGEGRPKTDFQNTTVEFSLVEPFPSPPTQQSIKTMEKKKDILLITSGSPGKGSFTRLGKLGL